MTDLFECKDHYVVFEGVALITSRYYVTVNDGSRTLKGASSKQTLEASRCLREIRQDNIIEHGLEQVVVWISDQEGGHVLHEGSDEYDCDFTALPGVLRMLRDVNKLCEQGFEFSCLFPSSLLFFSLLRVDSFL